MRIAVVALIVFCAAALVAQNAPAKAPASGFDASALDKSVDPCTDFYQFSCGSWLKNNPIPSDQAMWGRFNELHERNRAILRDILEKAAVNDPKRNAVDQKIGDYFASCMDDKVIEAKGMAPLKPQLDRINAIKSKDELPDLVAKMHQSGVGALFALSADQDFKDATQVIATVDQGGIGLPERDYYFKTDAKSVEIRKQYVEHVQKMFELMGEAPAKAASDAKIVMEIETALAKGSLDVTARRDPQNVYHKMSRAELEKLAPGFTWAQYFETADTPDLKSLNVAVPEFFKQFQTLVASSSLDNLKTYLRWQLIHASAHMLSDKFVQENFNFYNKTLTGQKEIRPRWKRCAAYTDGDLGEALGIAYVERTFGTEGKERTLAMVKQIEKAMDQDLSQLDWMTPETKKAAHEKLEKIANKIGYPDKWRDYGKLRIVRGDALGNSERANQFEFNRQMSKIGRPVDRQEWGMTPPTVNAYYNPQLNDINFPAGILQFPFFDKNRDELYNYGGIGAVIGHELTHGFDDEGRQFDGNGNLRDWWKPEDNAAFDKRGDCVVQQYASYVAVDDVKLNGKLTEGENVADNGGLRLALMAAMASVDDKGKGLIDGYTPEQRVFMGWGQIWCENMTPEIARLLAQTDPHSPDQYRVNGVLGNMPEFQKAFGCKSNAPMVRQNACRVW